MTGDKIVTAIALAGLRALEQTSWYKVARNKKGVYVSKSKKGPATVNIAGFTLDHPAVQSLKKPNGTVTGFLKADHPDFEEALALALEVVAGEGTGLGRF